jgi:hypothetical protein
MANIVTDFVERLRLTHRLMKRSAAPKPVEMQPDTRLPESKRRPQFAAHKPVDDHRLRASHLGG